MESYHSSSMPSSRGYSDMPVRNRADSVRQLRPFEYIATPPIQHVLDALSRHMRVGGSFAPGVRQLAEMSGVTLGMISGILYDLDRTGWIAYDGHVIMLLRDQADHESTVAPFDALGSLDQNPDRSRADMVLTATAVSTCFESDLVAVESEIPCADENDQPPDQPPDRPPAAQLMAELGANPVIIRDAYEARSDWTPSEVRRRWTYDQSRIAASDGRLNEGIFYTALRAGQLAPARPDPARPLDPASYAGDPAFRMGGDMTGLAEPPPDPAAMQPPSEESPYDEAGRILPEGAPAADRAFVACRLACGDDAPTALATLAAHRRARR